MTKEEYDRFANALVHAETAEIHGFENSEVFEGCMPIEVMAARGAKTLLFGPLKPVGLENPKDGKTPYAVVQLRQATLLPPCTISWASRPTSSTGNKSVSSK